MRIKFNYWKDGKKKALTMSYDDGNVADRRLVELFNAHGIKGTFHLNSGRFSDWTISPDEIPTLYAGHEVSAHSLTHHFMECTPREEVCYEVLEDRRRLANHSHGHQTARKARFAASRESQTACRPPGSRNTGSRSGGRKHPWET